MRRTVTLSTTQRVNPIPIPAILIWRAQRLSTCPFSVRFRDRTATFQMTRIAGLRVSAVAAATLVRKASVAS
jgi:hypothetical protein